MHCALCNTDLNDGVKCGSCKKQLCFGCSNITEAGYRKLGADRRAAWRCSYCRNLLYAPSTPTPTTSPPIPAINGGASIDMVLQEIRDLKLQLHCLPALIDDVKSIRREIQELKSSCEFNSEKIINCESRITDLESKTPKLEQIKITVDSTLSEISTLKKELAAKEQWSRLNNVEIKGVPLKRDENLFSIVENICTQVGYTIPKHQINYIARVPTHFGKDKSIIVNFINRYIKEEFVAAARAKKFMTAKDIGFVGNEQRLYVNDHLTPYSKTLLTKTKAICKDKAYQYVWVKYCKIHVRKNDTTRVMIITSDSDLNKLA
ncbi:unnamed protein product [Parnassius mnemosyne]|uniref:FP protein C-terminal domain-containing protein n=1 Tax=Parnassius mnemosyne TaxID=213953 RepID=A0AAV1LYN2_9NEOP